MILTITEALTIVFGQRPSQRVLADAVGCSLVERVGTMKTSVLGGLVPTHRLIAQRVDVGIWYVPGP